MKEKLIPVENEEGLYRDSNSGAIINVNSESYSNYRIQKRIRDEKKFKEMVRESEINTLKCSISNLEKRFDLLNEKSDKIFNLLEQIIRKDVNT